MNGHNDQYLTCGGQIKDYNDGVEIRCMILKLS